MLHYHGDDQPHKLAGTITYSNPYSTTFAITPRALTVAANNATKYSDQDTPAFTACYSGFDAGDSPAALTGKLVFTSATTASWPALPAALP